MRKTRLRRLWFNPVFQRNYKLSRVKNLIEPKPAFIVGLILSVAINIFIVILSARTLHAWSDLFSFSYLFSVGGPIIAIYFVIYFRMFVTCLISTPTEIKKDIGSDNLSPVMSTPMSDAELYYAVSLPNYVKGLETIASYMSLAAGLLIPCIVVGIFTLFISEISFPVFAEVALIIVASGALLVGCLVSMMFLMSLASGTFAITLPTFAAILATLVFYVMAAGIVNIIPNFLSVVLGGIANYGVIVPFWLTTPFNTGDFLDDNSSSKMRLATITYLFGSLVAKILLTWIFCIVTSAMGKSALSKMRRAGYYEPEYCNAAGLE